MIHQSTVETSAMLLERILNDVPFTMLPCGVLRFPCTTITVLVLTMIMLFVVTAVVLIVTSPATSVAVPALAFVPVAIFSLLPAVVRLTFPATSKAFARDGMQFMPALTVVENVLSIATARIWVVLPFVVQMPIPP